MSSQTMSVANVSNDDGWMYSGNPQNNNTLNACGHFSGLGGCDIWYRFKIVTNIAQSSTINSCTFRQVGYATDSSTTFTARVKLEKVASAADITTGAQLDGRTYCSDKPSLSNISVTADTNYDVSLATAFQELVNYTALAANDYVLVTIEDQGSSSGVNRLFKSRDDGDHPKLLVDWSAPVTNYNETATGGIRFGGAATFLKESNHTGTGGIVFGTGITPSVASAYTAEGGILFAGDNPEVQGYNDIAEGGILFGGDNEPLKDSPHTATGGIEFGGEALTYNAYEETGTGGIVFGGAATSTATYEVTPTGGIVFGGNVSGEYGQVDTATGGIEFGGEATLALGYGSTATGGIVFGGAAGVSSTAANHYSDTATGGIEFGGAAVDSVSTPADLSCCQINYEDTSTGGIEFGGAATVASSGETATGGIVFAGSATVETNQTYEDFIAVYHLDEQGNGTASEFEDSSQNNYHGTGGDGFEIRTPTRTAGIFSAANYFDGNEFIACPEFNTTDDCPITITLWAKRENQFLRRIFYSIGKTDGNVPEGWQIRLGHDDRQRATAAVQVDTGDDWAQYHVTDADVLSDDCWHHLAAVWQPGVSLSLYVDGILVDTVEVEETDLVPATDGSYIGRVDNIQYAQANLQEVRVSHVTRADDWLEADYAAYCDDDFYTVGNIETPVYSL